MTHRTPVPAASAERALRRQWHWSRRNASALSLLLGPGGASCVQWRHYPARDAVSADGGWQFYYHAHPEGRCPGEHGHIHLFRRTGPGQLTPALALALDARGNPAAWFTTNLWVTGGQWGQRATVLRELRQARLQLSGGRLRGVALWLQDLLHTYTSVFEALLAQRDAALLAHARATGQTRPQALQDRNLAVLSHQPMHWPHDALVHTAPEQPHRAAAAAATTF